MSPSPDNLINNLPDVLKSSRQFLAWNLEHGQKKVPLNGDGSSWGSYKDPTCWRTFPNVLDLIGSGRAFGLGLVLPSQEQAEKLPEFNLITGLVAVDGDAKRSLTATPFNVPEHICAYVRSFQTYCEFSTSQKGLRALAFGTIPTEKQNLTKSFGDGTELSLYQGGWVTLSGLPQEDSTPTIEHRQDVLDRILENLWPDLNVDTAATKKLETATVRSARFDDRLLLDWSRSASDDQIRQFIQGRGRTPEQVERMKQTWELKRGWNHGNTPDNSLYTKRIVEEALWLQPLFGWSLQDVVDIVITFCKKNQLRWSFGRATKQIRDGRRHILATTSRPMLYGSGLDDAVVQHTTPPPTLTCTASQISREENRIVKPTVTSRDFSDLPTSTQAESPDSLSDVFGANEEAKVSGGFKHKSAARDTVLRAIGQHPGWVKPASIAAETGKSVEAVRKQLQRLGRVSLVDCNGKGRYRKHRERQKRKLKPCRLKPIPRRRNTIEERKTLSRSELTKRGWPVALIEKVFPQAGKDYLEREIDLGFRIVRARFYWVARIRTIERQPWFEVERAEMKSRAGPGSSSPERRQRRKQP